MTKSIGSATLTILREHIQQCMCTTPVVNGDFPAIAVANHHRKAYDLFLALGHCMSIVLGATIPSALGFNIIKHTGGPGARLALTNIES